jgi:hypothetical protein
MTCAFARGFRPVWLAARDDCRAAGAAPLPYPLAPVRCDKADRSWCQAHGFSLAKPQKSHQGKPVGYLMFDPVVRTGLKYAQHPHLEHQHWVICLRHIRSGAGRNSSLGTTVSPPSSGVLHSGSCCAPKGRKTPSAPSQYFPASLRLDQLSELTSGPGRPLRAAPLFAVNPLARP